MHAKPTPLLGGVAVYLGFATATVVFLKPVIPAQVGILLVGAAAFGVIGLVDDLRNVGAWKLAVEGAVVAVLVWLGGFKVNLPWPYMGEALAILWIVGAANAWNCLDCTDGVTAGTAVICALALAPLAIFAHRWGVAVGALAVAGAALGFLRYNFPPARIFLGNAGSLTLGFLLAALGAAIAAPRTSPAQLIAPALILGIPCYDFLLVHWRRYRSGMKNPLQILTSTGKDHLPHRLLDGGLSHRHVALWIYTASTLLGATAVALVLWGPLSGVTVVMLLVATASFVGWGLGTVHEGRGELAGRRPARAGEGLASPEGAWKP